MEGIKRINDMAKGQKDFVLLEIVKYLINRTDMNEKYLNEEKTLKGMAAYIRDEILKDICKKMNSKNPINLAQDIKYNGKDAKCLTMGMSEEKTYELGINYFNKSNEELGIKSEETKKKEIKNNKEDDEFGSIFGSLSENIEEKKDEIEQISLFAA